MSLLECAIALNGVIKTFFSDRFLAPLYHCLLVKDISILYSEGAMNKFEELIPSAQN